MSPGQIWLVLAVTTVYLGTHTELAAAPPAPALVQTSNAPSEPAEATASPSRKAPEGLGSGRGQRMQLLIKRILPKRDEDAAVTSSAAVGHDVQVATRTSGADNENDKANTNPMLVVAVATAPEVPANLGSATEPSQVAGRTDLPNPATAKSYPAEATANQGQVADPSLQWHQDLVLRQLAVQTALQQARQALADGAPQTAVELLESHLSAANGSDVYLETLGEAYRKRIAQLLLSKQFSAAQSLSERLQILQPSPGKQLIHTSDQSTALPPEAVSAPSGALQLASANVSAQKPAASSTTPTKSEPTQLSTPASASTSSSPKEVGATTNNPLGPPATNKPSPADLNTTESTDDGTAPSSHTAAPTVQPTVSNSTIFNSTAKETDSSPLMIPVALAKPVSRRDFKTKINSNSPLPSTQLTVRGQDVDTLEEPPATTLNKVREAASIDLADSNRGTASQRLQAENYISKANSYFKEKDYSTALTYYEEAYQANPLEAQRCRPNWGYSLLCVTIDRYNLWCDSNFRDVSPEEWENLELDFREACRLAPANRTWVESQRVFELIAANRLKHARPTPVKIKIRHLQEPKGDWRIVESENFRVHYLENSALAEEVAQIAEQSRQEICQKWFPREEEPRWEPQCEIYLHRNAQEYSMNTRAIVQSPGHTVVGPTQFRGRPAISRRIELRADERDMRRAVLPHEITHAVVAGHFGAQSLPRWADEGMAVLIEPRDKQQGHLSNLLRLRQTGPLPFTLQQVFAMQQYPPGQAMGHFYAMSFGLCQYLVQTGGEERFIQFVRKTMSGYRHEQALRELYQINSFADLERRYEQFIIGANAGYASR